MRWRHAASRLAPEAWRTRRWVDSELRDGEPELRLVAGMLRGGSTFVDVGANAGLYSLVALRRGCRVVAFEPVPAEAARLRRRLRRDSVVHQVALSDSAGEAVLRIPHQSGRDVTTRSSLEADADPDLPHRSVPVAVATLDSFGLADVGFVKIDVEGHELAALRGAAGTLSRWRPGVLVEVEEPRAPGSLAAARDLFGRIGYDGFWYDGRRLQPLATFDPAVHQARRPYYGEPRGAYVNNLLWMPASPTPGPVGRAARR